MGKTGETVASDSVGGDRVGSDSGHRAAGAESVAVLGRHIYLWVDFGSYKAGQSPIQPQQSSGKLTDFVW